MTDLLAICLLKRTFTIAANIPSFSFHSSNKFHRGHTPVQPAATVTKPASAIKTSTVKNNSKNLILCNSNKAQKTSTFAPKPKAWAVLQSTTISLNKSVLPFYCFVFHVDYGRVFETDVNSVRGYLFLAWSINTSN